MKKYKSFIIFSSFKARMRLNRFAENTSKQKTVDTAKLKKINKNN